MASSGNLIELWLNFTYFCRIMTFNFKSFYETSTSFTSNSICFLCREFQSSKYDPGYPGHGGWPGSLYIQCLRGQTRPLSAAPGHEAAQQTRLARWKSRRGQGGGRGQAQGARLPQCAQTEDAGLQPPWQHQLRGNIQTQVWQRGNCVKHSTFVRFWFAEPAQLTLFLSQKLLYVGEESNQQRRFFQIQKQ